MSAAALGARHRELTRLRALARDRHARDDAGLVVIDGPRAIDGALARCADIETLYVDADAARAAHADVVSRAAQRGVAVREVAAGALGRAADVRTSAGLLAVAQRPPAQERAVLRHGALWLVCAEIGDPGNLGTLMRSAEAAGAAGIVVGRGSVDAYNPKTVRASAGAVFGITVLEDDIVTVLSDLATHGVHRLGAVARGGVAPSRCTRSSRTAIVLGHETRGIEAAPGGASRRRAGVESLVDELVTIQMAGAAESLNVAMAGTVLLFEVAKWASESVAP